MFRKKKVYDESGAEVVAEKSGIDSLKDWVKAMFVGFSIAIVGIVIMGLVVVRLESDKREQDKKQQQEQAVKDAQNLLTRQVESCKNYNVDQTRNRVFAREQIISVVENLMRVKPTPEQVEEFKASEGIQHYYAFIDTSYPYRNCTEPCVIAATSPDIEDCPPATTEGGET